MTVGNNILDTGGFITCYDSSGSLGSSGNYVGRLLTRSWNGADRLNAEPLPQVTTRHWSADTPSGKAVVVRKRYRPRSKALEPHPYSMTAVNAVSHKSAFTRFGDYGGNVGYYDIAPHRLFGGFPPHTPFPIWTANDDIKLINQLKEKSRGTEFNLGTFLGEGREALEMIGNSAIRIARSLSYLRRGNVFAAAQVLSESASVQTSWRALNRKLPRGYIIRRRAVDQLSSNWLELAWGWLPLVQDIRSGAEFLAHQLNVPFVSRVVARRTIKGPPPAGNGYKWGSKGASVQKQIVAYFSEPESIPKQLGLTDPLTVAWELAPLSALVDYVVPIGGWLEARGYTQGLTGKFVLTTTYRKDVGNLILGSTFERVPGYPAYYVGDDKGSYYRSTQMERTVTTTLDVPFPRVKPLEEVATFRHCVNALAVLAQVSQGKLKSIPRGG